jgi:hypothetical protein
MPFQKPALATGRFGPEAGAQPLDELAFTRRPQIFFRTISARMCLSSERSATRRLSFAFSSRSCRSSRISLLPKFAYFFF